ncbi:hypothetical protein GCM10025865_22300 [Paraoerskovia sediminicola]|uniref:Uncharacterized protein n=1 Tax=Paraoerskovia sediminicola TaxID=1138587 RepID=A0ABM8G461_9CELL|nr:hypothetical protein GCM10025865_22300 [Paraoerskovia sediminicola]
MHHEQWLSDLSQSGTGYPAQAGYGLMAWLVLHTGWHAWLGLPEDSPADRPSAAQPAERGSQPARRRD